MKIWKSPKIEQIKMTNLTQGGAFLGGKDAGANDGYEYQGDDIGVLS